jgi:hypothetical protein
VTRRARQPSANAKGAKLRGAAQVDIIVENIRKKWTEWTCKFGNDDGDQLHRYLVLQKILGPAGEFELFEGVGYDDERSKKLVRRAVKNDADADAVLCYVAAGYVFLGRRLPDYLASYICALLIMRAAAPSPRRRGGAWKMSRNIFIVDAILRLGRKGFSPTRNDITLDVESGCSIVAKALEMGERAVAQVWRDRMKIWGLHPLASSVSKRTKQHL